jgi:hypothetical protein
MIDSLGRASPARVLLPSKTILMKLITCRPMGEKSPPQYFESVNASFWAVALSRLEHSTARAGIEPHYVHEIPLVRPHSLAVLATWF